jgi:predicted N-acyltransferase
MKRFQKIDTEKELTNHIVSKLKEIGYVEVKNFTDGDEDFLMIDTLKKEYIWCENGFSPFCDYVEMLSYENVSNPNSISLWSIFFNYNTLK